MFNRYKILLLAALLPSFSNQAVAIDSPLNNYLQQQALREQLRATYGKGVLSRIDQWVALIKGQEGMAERSKIESVNRYFNQLVYVPDQRLWGQNDYWARPLEFLGARGGDCEDYSLGKYYTLMELGVAEEKLRLVYVKALEYNQFHMVLAYYPTKKADPLVLDNIKSGIYPASRRPDLLPVYSFDAKSLWIMNQRKESQLAGDADRLKLWSDYRSRIGQGNFKSPRMTL
ncbi:MAG: transglutaminase-like cysteine peptidase [Aeromonadaceae bacterium]